MSNFSAGTRFNDGDTCTAQSLTNLIELADAVPAFITSKTTLTATAAGDYVLVSDTSESGALRRVPLANVLPTDTSQTLAGVALRNTAPQVSLMATDQTYGYAIFQSAGDFYLKEFQQSNADPRTTPFKVLANSVADAIVVSTAGVGIGGPPGTGWMLDAAGAVRGTALAVKAYSGGTRRTQLGNDATTGYLFTALDSDGSAVAAVLNWSLAAGAAEAITVAADGKVGIKQLTPTSALDVTGNIHASLSVSAETNVYCGTGSFWRGGVEGKSGTLVVTGTWNGGSSGSRTLTIAGGIITNVT